MIVAQDGVAVAPDNSGKFAVAVPARMFSFDASDHTMPPFDATSALLVPPSASVLPAIVSLPANSVAVPPPVAGALRMDEPEPEPERIRPFDGNVAGAMNALPL